MTELNTEFWEELGFLNGLTDEQKERCSFLMTKMAEHMVSHNDDLENMTVVLTDADGNNREVSFDISACMFVIVRRLVEFGKYSKVESAESLVDVFKNFVENCDLTYTDGADMESECLELFCSQF